MSMPDSDSLTGELLEETLSHLAALVAFDTQNPPRQIQADTGLLAWYASMLPDDFSTRLDDYGEGCASLLAVRGQPSLVFNVHIDTVPATEHWERDPLRLSREGDRVYGLGTCDIKGAAACLLSVARNCEGDLAILLTSDEEAGDNRCVARFLDSDHGFSHVVVSEPTRCRAVLAHRGIVSMRAQFSAAAGHASEPRALRENALHQAARWLAAALDWAAGQERSVRFDDLAGVCFNTGTIAGGVKNNVIAPTASVGFGLRPLPGQDVNSLLSDLQALHAGPGDVRWQRSYSGPALPGGESLQAAGSFPKAIARSEALAHALRLPVGKAVNFWTEAALFSAAGLPALVFGPGDIGQAHCADEWVAVADLECALLHYQRIVAGRLGDRAARRTPQQTELS
jgi:acetylornithine deacetylase